MPWDMGIPTMLIEPLRSALQSQGIDPATITNGGTINPAGLLSAAFDTVEFRSSATPTIRIRTSQLLAGGPPNPFLTWLRPTVVLTGKSGTITIAPAGESKGGSILPGALVVLSLVGIGYALGRTSG